MDTDDVLGSGTYVLPTEIAGPADGKRYQLKVTVQKQGATVPDGAVIRIRGDLKVMGPIRGRGTIIVDGKITISPVPASSGDTAAGGS